MEALSAAGAVRVHRSMADLWAAETRRPPPPLALVDGGPRFRPPCVAACDCVARGFQPSDSAETACPCWTSGAAVEGPPYLFAALGLHRLRLACGSKKLNHRRKICANRGAGLLTRLPLSRSKPPRSGAHSAQSLPAHVGSRGPA